MTPENILQITDRDGFRQWLVEHHAHESECWLAVKRGWTVPEGVMRYLDAVEEALCFGWIDSTVKTVDGVTLQRFGPRKKCSKWSELNKERCRRLEVMGLMTDSGRRVCPDLNAEFEIIQEIMSEFKKNPVAWRNFRSFPKLYQRVRIDTIQVNKKCLELFERRLYKLIEASEKGEMIGEWNDGGRLLDY